MTFVDNFLNKITMYRLVLYYLVALLLVAAFFGLVGILPYSPADIAFSTAIILGTCWITNRIFVQVFEAQSNNESLYITALILALIITPVAATDSSGIGFLVFASAWAMASKFIFAIGKKHVFNPAAFGVALGALVLAQAATWWVAGNVPLLPFVVLGGLLIVRKIRRFDLVLSFFAVALVTVVLTSSSTNVLTPITQTILHSSIFFLGLVMLTEPLTMPPSRWLRIFYGALVGFLFTPTIHFGSLYFTPELALLTGNIFVYVVSPKGRYMLTLLSKRELSVGTYEFSFASDRPFSFKPGQYIEWTLAHRFADNRGTRRYFTIASSPTEKIVRLGVRFYKPASTFKRRLWSLKERDTISASHIAGDFVLPRDTRQKLAFIAGGIGVTPFRSMAKYLSDTRDTRDVTMLYSNKTAEEISYRDIFDEASRTIGMKTVYALTDEPQSVPGMYHGFIDAALIQKEIPDYAERLFYISGPHGMVDAFQKTLRELGVPRRQVKVDYFPGFA